MDRRKTTIVQEGCYVAVVRWIFVVLFRRVGGWLAGFDHGNMATDREQEIAARLGRSEVDWQIRKVKGTEAMRDSNVEVGHRLLGVKDLGIPLVGSKEKNDKPLIGLSLVLTVALVAVASVAINC